MKKQLKKLEIVNSKGKTKEEIVSELESEGFSYYEWSDMPGAYYSSHSHEHDECICVLRGKISFFVTGKEYKLESGEKLYLPKGTVHESRNKSSRKVTYLIGEIN